MTLERPLPTADLEGRHVQVINAVRRCTPPLIPVGRRIIISARGRGVEEYADLEAIGNVYSGLPRVNATTRKSKQGVGTR